jgi:hypothetical protein
VITLAQLAYLPTLAIWGMAFVAGPGFAVGTDTAVSPAGTQLGPVPGIPALGALPESTTPWLLLLALLPVALGALAGWIARSRLVAPPAVEDAAPPALPIDEDAAGDPARSSALAALLAGVETPRPPGAAEQASLGTDDAAEGTDDAPQGAEPDAQSDRIGARTVIALGIAVLAAAGAALLSALASGSIGPGRLAEVGPQPGAVALAVGVEVLLGAAILLLSPRRRPKAAPTPEKVPDAEAAPLTDAETAPDGETASLAPTQASTPATEAAAPAPEVSASARPRPTDPDSTPTVDLGPRRPTPLPPVD